MDQREFVFVYGTLMRGRIHHHKLVAEDAAFCGEGYIRDFGLYDVGEVFPGVVRKKGPCVLGELYAIRPSTLRIIDELEDEGRHYAREKVLVTLLTGHRVDAWVYVWLGPVDPTNEVPETDQPWTPC